jgi:hypothetical protein
MIEGMKLIIGTPSGESINALTMGCMDKLKIRHKPFICNAIGTYVERNQNLIVEEGLSHPSIEWFMFIDSDMLFPETIVDTLAAHKRDIVGCTYRTRQPPHNFTSVGFDGVFSTGKETGVREVLQVPSGMMLVRRKVFEHSPFPWFSNTYGTNNREFVGNDVNFCRQSRVMGFKIFCDFFTSRSISHFGGCAIAWGGPQ